MDWDTNKPPIMNSLPCSAYEAGEQIRIAEQKSAEQTRKDNALFQTAQSSVDRNQILEKQLEEAIQQNAKLEESNQKLNALYEQAKKDSEENAITAKTSKRQASISIVVSVVAVIVAIVMGVLGIAF